MIEDLRDGDIVESEFIVLESFDVDSVDGFDDLFLELGAKLFRIGPDADGFVVSRALVGDDGGSTGVGGSVRAIGEVECTCS